MPRYSAQPTPNPNSLKLVRTDGGTFIDKGLVSCKSMAEAAAHPLAAALFSLPGVEGLLVLPQFLTVTRAEGAAWDTVLPAVEAALDAYYAV